AFSPIAPGDEVFGEREVDRYFLAGGPELIRGIVLPSGVCCPGVFAPTLLPRRRPKRVDRRVHRVLERQTRPEDAAVYAGVPKLVEVLDMQRPDQVERVGVATNVRDGGVELHDVVEKLSADRTHRADPVSIVVGPKHDEVPGDAALGDDLVDPGGQRQ